MKSIVVAILPVIFLSSLGHAQAYRCTQEAIDALITLTSEMNEDSRELANLYFEYSNESSSWETRNAARISARAVASHAFGRCQTFLDQYGPFVCSDGVRELGSDDLAAACENIKAAIYNW